MRGIRTSKEYTAINISILIRSGAILSSFDLFSNLSIVMLENEESFEQVGTLILGHDMINLN